jgi:hypothetical protein
MMITVAVASEHSQIQDLISLAGFFKGIWWYTAFDPGLQKYLWQFDFFSLDSAQHFLMKLPADCTGVITTESLQQLRQQQERDDANP